MSITKPIRIDGNLFVVYSNGKDKRLENCIFQEGQEKEFSLQLDINNSKSMKHIFFDFGKDGISCYIWFLNEEKPYRIFNISLNELENKLPNELLAVI